MSMSTVIITVQNIIFWGGSWMCGPKSIEIHPILVTVFQEKAKKNQHYIYMQHTFIKIYVYV